MSPPEPEKTLGGADEGAALSSATFMKPHYPIEVRVEAEQLRLLYSLGQTSRFTTLLCVLLVGFVFHETAPIWATPVLLCIQIIAQFSFDKLRAAYNSATDTISNARKWAHRYALLTIISGTTWGMGAILWLPGAPVTHEIFYMMVLAVLIMATAITRAPYPPAVMYYSVTAATPVLVMLLMRGEALPLIVVALALVFLFIVANWARRISKEYSEAFRLRFENADLMERMMRLHAAAEQRRQNAEEAEARATAAIRTKQEFLKIVGHEVRAPLEGLRNMAVSIAEEATSETQIKLALAMEETSNLLRRLLDDMIDYSELESLSLELHPRSFNPVELTARVVRMMRHQAVGRGLSLELDSAPETDTFMKADMDRIQQVLANLISNAIKFTYQGGVMVRIVSFTTSENETMFRFSITDTGPGLPDNIKAHLFDTFSQGAEAQDFRYAGEKAGIGLGLAISERLVRFMGGHIGVDSTAGQGSTFWFVLPAEPGKGAAYLSALRKEQVTPPTPKQATLVDHDALYGLEERLGDKSLREHLSAALQRLLSIQTRLEEATARNEYSEIVALARDLRMTALETGLPAIAHEAAQILETAGRKDTATTDRNIPRLQQTIADTWQELARTYPSILS